MSHPKLLHLFNSFEVGGVERQHMMLVTELASDYEQACWSYIEGPIQEELDVLGVPHQVGKFDAAIDMIEQGNFDCIVLRTNRYMREMAAYLQQCPVPVVYIRSFLRWWEGNGAYFDEELERLSYSFPSHTFFSGPSLLEAALSLGVDIPGAELLFNGVQMDKFPMTQRRAPENPPLRVGMLANFSPHKNQHTAIEVMKSGLRSGKYTLTLGGEALYPEYAATVRDSAEGLPVKFKGYVSNVPEFFEEVDMLLMSSTHEGWPIVIMEAMAAGIPVIAPDVGDTSVLLGNGDFGLIYPAGEFGRIPELLDTLTDPATYARYARASTERGREFDIRATAAKLSRGIRKAMRSPL